MNTLLLQPNDVLFFKDGRPMSGGLAGHGAAWPLPTVTDLALHAALHRSGITGHPHRRGQSGVYTDQRDRRFGSLLTAGPFPVFAPEGGAHRWFFPRPADLGSGDDAGTRLEIVLRPVALAEQWPNSSLPKPACFAVASCRPPAKETDARPWLDRVAFECYLNAGSQAVLAGNQTRRDADIFLPEHNVGIGLDPATGAQDGQRIYSAHYLRLRDEWRLGVLADGREQGANGADERELVRDLFTRTGDSARIIVGGQQRICLATRSDATRLPLPGGKKSGFEVAALPGDMGRRWLVKWVLLSPAVWPAIPAKSKDGRDMKPHPGGWLPNWVSLDWGETKPEPRDHANNGKVLLLHRTGAVRRDYSGPKAKRVAENERPIAARLVAALVPKPLAVTGYFLPHEAAERNGGAKPTHLAVPAGAVYYFAAESEADAGYLAAALNWHGATDGTEIKNRRSTLFGEKGFGLGACGTWSCFSGPAQAPS